jgi:hypothetical protein
MLSRRLRMSPAQEETSPESLRALDFDLVYFLVTLFWSLTC